MKQPDMHPLQIARAQRHLTRKRLAEEIGVGEATIGRAEHNKPVSAEVRRLICAYFGMTAQELGLHFVEQKATSSPNEEMVSLPLPEGNEHLSPGHSIVGNELLTVYRNGIMALYKLYMSGHPHHVEALLPLYATQTAALCEAGGALLLPAARLASLAQQLICELATDREDFGVGQISGQRAFDYAQLACDPNLEVAALIKQGSLGFHRRDGRVARHAYDQAIMLAHDKRVTPLLRGRAYAGAAEVYAMRGEEQDALRVMGLAYDLFPVQPEQDSAYPYLYASRYSLHVFGACQTHLFLSHPKDAQKALEALEREENTDATKEPITRLDLLYYQAEIQVQQAEQEAVLATLTEAAQLALHLGSMLYFRKLATIYHAVRARWPHDKAVRSLCEIFL